MKKYFVVSDVHSYYDELQKSLVDNGWDINNPNHILISCGDLTDRGKKPVECLKFVTELHDQNRAILIRGNHEDLMEQAIARHYFQSHDYHNCTNETVMYVTGCNYYNEGDDVALDKMKNNELWNKYVNATVNYAEIGDRIFVHGWIPVGCKELDGYGDIPKIYRPFDDVYDPDWRNADEDWEEARWLNGMKMWLKGIREPNKTIYCGHYHTSWGHSHIHNDGKEFLAVVETYYIDPDTGKQEPHANFSPFIDDGIIAIDGCTAVSGIVNCVTFESEE